MLPAEFINGVAEVLWNPRAEFHPGIRDRMGKRQVGGMQGVPADPQRTPLVYDRETGRVKLSPNSPLSPLPETLSRR